MILCESSVNILRVERGWKFVDRVENDENIIRPIITGCNLDFSVCSEDQQLES